MVVLEKTLEVKKESLDNEQVPEPKETKIYSLESILLKT